MDQITEIIEKENDISVQLSDEQIRDIVIAIEEQDSDTVNASVDELSIAETADLIAKVDGSQREELLAMCPDTLEPAVLTELDDELQRQVLNTLDIVDLVQIISSADSDDALNLIESLDDELQKQVIRKLSTKNRIAVQEGLGFPEDSAGRLMSREFVAIPQFWSVGKAIDYMREVAEDLPEDFFDVYTIDPAYHVIGQIPLNKLVRADRATKMADIYMEDLITLNADMDQEQVADIFRRDNITSAPVTDGSGRLIGVITIDDVIDVIDEEAEEDILKMAGVGRADLYKAVWSTTGTRFRWLFLNLITAILASVVISWFDATIEQIVALAVLMPIVASMGGNAGTQSLTVAVRALATHEISRSNMWRMIWKETLVGSLNGVMFAVITGGVTGFWFGDAMLGIVIASAMVITLLIAGFFGAGIPIVIERLGRDPAISSTVFLTTVTDVVGFLTFLGLASLMLIH